MSEKHITRRSLHGPRRTVDVSRYEAIADSDIQAGIDADPDAAPVLDDAWFSKARLVTPGDKVPVTIRLDRDIVEFFKDAGAGYQTRINHVLRVFMEHQRTNR